MNTHLKATVLKALQYTVNSLLSPGGGGFLISSALEGGFLERGLKRGGLNQFLENF